MKLSYKSKALVYFFTMLLILLAFSCRTKTQNTHETENKEKLYTQAQFNDSLAKIEKRKEEAYLARLKEIEERNKKESESTSKSNEVDVTIEHKGGKTVVETPSGNFVVTGDGAVVNTSSRNKSMSKKQIEEHNRKVSEITEIKLENENLKSELRVQEGQIVELEEKLEAERKSNTKTVSCNYTIFFWIIGGLLLIIAILIFRKWLVSKIPFLGKFKIFNF